MTKRAAISHQLVALMMKAERIFSHAGAVHLPPVVIKATEDAWSAFVVKDYCRVERLAQVIELLIARNQTKFRADPAKWVERQKDAA